MASYPYHDDDGPDGPGPLRPPTEQQRERDAILAEQQRATDLRIARERAAFEDAGAR